MNSKRVLRPEDLEPPRGLAHRLVEALTREIQDQQLRPGERLPTEPELMARFGVSRTVVREAMSRLQAAGLVVTRHGAGTFVRPQEPGGRLIGAREGAGEQTFADKLEMLELRMSVESAAAALAAQRRTPQQLEELRARLDAFATAVAVGASTVAEDARFHLQIAVATGNRYFEEVLRNLGSATIPRDAAGLGMSATELAQRASTRGSHPASPALAPYKTVALMEHEAIYDAIRRSDAQAARAAMFMHLSNSLQRLRALAGLEA
ncbi:FadR/GntR family transcriptional regulator [Caldimonas tepidiphila]|uniref:FadR/GntR family transcriptional regulator n=1 Tax=Caldimonas tepidiphila TaxID=2315841 RepID=UPI000E5B8F3A|nr:FadR/GntR family transcriptional regulator [Caldimonas tepidiphila]